MTALLECLDCKPIIAFHKFLFGAAIWNLACSIHFKILIFLQIIPTEELHKYSIRVSRSSVAGRKVNHVL